MRNTNKRQRNKAKLGRRPNEPSQQTNPIYANSPYGAVLPFIQLNGKKQTTMKPDALLLRNWSRNNPIVRRCINLIKDKLTKQPYEFVNKDKADETDYTEQMKMFNQMLEKPNKTDTRRTFFAAIAEDLVSGDCGCMEVALTGNPYRPLFLFPVDGFSMEFVLDNDKFAYAQRISTGFNLYSTPTDYKYFTKDEILYLKKQVFTNNPFGLSPIESAFEYIKALTQTFTYSTDIASNALPKYLANIKGAGTQLDAFRAYFINECMGTPNLPVVSADDVESVQIAPISEEATFRGYQEFVMSIIALSFNIPPEKVAVAKSNDRSTIEQLNESLLTECIQPYGDVIDEAINKLVALVGYGDKILFRYVWEETLSQKQTKQTMARDVYKDDIATRNEARKMIGLPPSDDEYGDEFVTVFKAKVNEKYGINGFGNAKANNAGMTLPAKGGDED